MKIRAKHKKTDRTVCLCYNSIEEAKKATGFYLTDFEAV
jgi:hypothetical protein